MGKMEQMAAKLATKYGTVSTGKHTGCEVALGNDPSQKVATSNDFKQIIFVNDEGEQGRYDIIRDFASFEVVSKGETGYKLQLNYVSGEVSTFELIIRPDDSLVKGFVKKLMGQKTTFGATDEREKMLLKYRGVRVFFNNTFTRYPYDQAMGFIDDFKTLNIDEPSDEKIVKILKELHNIKE